MGAPARAPQLVATTEIGFNESEKAFRESKKALVESKNALVETNFASNAPRTTSLEAKMITTKAKSASHH
jgi:hypothetical protein